MREERRLERVSISVGCALPAAPTGLAATVVGSTVTLTWFAAPGAAAYVIEAGSTPGATDLATVTTGSAATSFTAASVPTGVYFVRVRAANACGTNGVSNEVSVSVGSAGVPAPPGSELPVESCAAAATLRSISGASPTAIEFVNATAAPVRAYWLDYDGQRVLYGTLAPAARYVQHTYLTHPWVVTDEANQCHAVFLPGPTLRTATIR